MKKECLYCGKEFTGQPSVLRKRKFCSRECGHKGQSYCREKIDKNRLFQKYHFVRSLGYFARFEKNKTILMHREIIEEHIGRPLLRTEQVHHIDGNPRNNKPWNLCLCSNMAEHQKIERSGINCIGELLQKRKVIFNFEKKIYETI